MNRFLSYISWLSFRPTRNTPSISLRERVVVVGCVVLAVVSLIWALGIFKPATRPHLSNWPGIASEGEPAGTVNPTAGRDSTSVPVTPLAGVSDPHAHANLFPQPYRITQEYGQYVKGGAHYGLDLNATVDVIATAPIGGIVEDVLRDCVEGDQACGNGWGNHVWWQSAETGHHILLAHFTRIVGAIDVGTILVAGQQIGLTGSTGYATGPHVHLQVNLDSCCNNLRTTNPAWEFPWLRCDPEPVLAARFGAACRP